MKELSVMSNTDKASVLFSLFKSEIPAIILYIHNKSNEIISNPQSIYEYWDHDFGSVEIFKKHAETCRDLIQASGDRIWTLKGDFQHLFQDYTSKYTIFWLNQYVKQQLRFPKLAVCLKLLFE